MATRDGPRPRSEAASPAPVVQVQVMQALIARELVEGFGLPEREAARLLGLVPSSISQYLTGKRLGPRLDRYLGDAEARRLARGAAQKLMAGEAAGRTVLEATIALADEFGAGATSPPESPSAETASRRRQLPKWLRARIAGEQNAVAECMRLAQRSRDELTRALFRQIASDSLRHAEIVASLAAYLDRGIASSQPTGITRADVEALIAQEHAAEASNDANLGDSLGGVMHILWESMEADERKHDLLLDRLRREALAHGGRSNGASASEGAPTAGGRGRRTRRPRSAA
jgi:uncharacterized protein